MIRTTNSCCGNNAGLVEKFIGTAYDVVKTVYDNLGELQFIYDFLNKYGVLITVDSIDELKALPTTAKYTRVYTFSDTAGYGYTDYLYVDGDVTGVIPNDPTATGSWIVVASSTNAGGGSGDSGYIPWVYAQGSALGGETTIVVPNGAIGVPFIILNGYMNTVGRGFTFDVATLTVTLAQPLEVGDEVVLLLSGTPAVPDNPNVPDWIVFNWLYNSGVAVGGEQVINIPYTFQSVPAIFKNGLRYHPGLSTESYTIDAPNQRILLTEPLATNDRLVVQVGGESPVVVMSDRTIQEVARAANVRDEQVILSTNTTSFLNGKTIIYDEVAQRIYGLPALPTNVYISSVSNGQLTYNPGNISVSLIPVPNSAEQLILNLADDTGASSIGSTNGTVQEVLDELSGPYKATGAPNGYTREDRARRHLSAVDFGSPDVDLGASINAAFASIATEYSDSASILIRGGTVELPRGQHPSVTPILIEKHRSGSGSLSIVGEGQQTSTIDMTGVTGTVDGISGGTLGAVFGELRDFSVQHAPRSGIRLDLNSRMSLRNVSADFNGNEGIVFGNGFVNILDKILAKGNGSAGIRFAVDVEHNAHVINSGYALQNGGSGWVLGQMHYSTINSPASDQNGFYGYDIQKTDGLVINAPGSESNGRSGFYVSSSTAKGETDNLVINGAWANKNNLSQQSYPNLLYVQASDGKKARVKISNSRSLPLNGEVVPDVVADGVGAEITLEHNNLPNGFLARNGGYLRHVQETLLVRSKTVPLSTATPICNLKSTQGHLRYSGTLTIVAGNNDPSTENRNTAIYHLLISKSIISGSQVTVIAKSGHTNGGSASAPSFNWTIASDQLVATPVDALAGGVAFWFEIDAASQVIALPL